MSSMKIGLSARSCLAMAAALAMVLLVGCQSQRALEPTDSWAVGTCMLMESPSSFPSGESGVPCSTTHTHVVVARVAADANFPQGRRSSI